MLRYISVIVAMFALLSCSDVNDDRIPVTAVNIDLGNQGYWDTYGVHTVGQFRYFIKSEKQPADFPYTAMTYTGFGGILLVTDLSGSPLAYDLACPVECTPNVRVVFDTSTLQAVCHKCGSRYDVCEFNGSPLSGPAHEHKYGLRRYRAVRASAGGYTIVF